MLCGGSSYGYGSNYGLAIVLVMVMVLTMVMNMALVMVMALTMAMNMVLVMIMALSMVMNMVLVMVMALTMVMDLKRHAYCTYFLLTSLFFNLRHRKMLIKWPLNALFSLTETTLKNVHTQLNPLPTPVHFYLHCCQPSPSPKVGVSIMGAPLWLLLWLWF